jgi:hypothetical protein
MSPRRWQRDAWKQSVDSHLGDDCQLQNIINGN